MVECLIGPSNEAIKTMPRPTFKGRNRRRRHGSAAHPIGPLVPSFGKFLVQSTGLLFKCPRRMSIETLIGQKDIKNSCQDIDAPQGRVQRKTVPVLGVLLLQR